MTQVITVSPMTAAYASEAYKPRDSRNSPLEKAISDWHARAVESADAYDRGLLNVVRPPSLQLAFLTAAHHSYRHVSLDQAIAEYAYLEGPKQPDEEELQAVTDEAERENTSAEHDLPGMSSPPPAAPLEAASSSSPMPETQTASPASIDSTE
ncbi:hypothetical protein [Rhizobium sp. L1K21]|uniref:hypothetical protein n=1 Tax=Rhizobium sp. L1K21 TaxID=2954933 RepID=UPI00209325B9|nr:hypothetical protein [Rhizobium sp. L1K21]MCO6185920.1 hypothetical protein [Rhizobium sp. L1K21]